MQFLPSASSTRVSSIGPGMLYLWKAAASASVIHLTATNRNLRKSVRSAWDENIYNSSIGDPPELTRRPLVLPDILLDRSLLRGIEALKFRHVRTRRRPVLSRGTATGEQNRQYDGESHGTGWNVGLQNCCSEKLLHGRVQLFHSPSSELFADS